jgi:phage replication-related protein YjqB (UPF0714/DUF867 family)
MPPTCYADILKAGHRRDRDFEVVIGNRENIRTCLVVAPHGGKIEPLTSEIARAVADVSVRAFYLFVGLLRRNNWGALHIASTSFDEPDFEALVADTELVVSFHGAQGDRDRGRNIYVGGRHEEGRALMIEALNPALHRFGIAAVDAATANGKQSIAGLDRRNLTNRGRTGRGIQLEFSDRARLAFFPGRVQRLHPKEHLTILAQTVDAVLRRLTNFPVHKRIGQGIK